MLTPRFELKDEPNTLRLVINAPCAKVSETEIYIDGKEFKFYSKPYYLRLNLPGALVEDGREDAKYDGDTGKFTIVIPKEVPGEKFEGLDMLTKLLAPTGQTNATGPIIEVLDGESCVVEDNDEDDFDWQIEQSMPEEDEISLDAPKYGFANLKFGLLKNVQEEAKEVIEIKDADSIPSSKRRELRMERETEQFDDDYYLADLFQNDIIKGLLEYKPPWLNPNTKGHVKGTIFTEEEKDRMLQLPRKEYLLDKRAQKSALLGLVDILFAYTYNHRTNLGDHTSESAWNITKLSAILSWFETHTSVEDVAISSYRRSLSYPLYRHWELCNMVFRDVVALVAAGRQYILKALLDIHKLFMAGDSYYLLNDLYITDYAVWIQSVSEKRLHNLHKRLNAVSVSKEDVQLDIDVLEQAGYLAIAEEQVMTDSISKNMEGLNLGLEKQGNKSSTSDSDTSDSECCSGDSCSDTDSANSADEHTEERESSASNISCDNDELPVSVDGQPCTIEEVGNTNLQMQPDEENNADVKVKSKSDSTSLNF